MDDLLGLKKTDRYWLLHKNVFEWKEIVDQMRVNIESFEKWYANQVKYHKVTGEEPGRELKEWSFSIRDLSELLEIEESVVYDLIKREGLETVIVDYWKRIPKKSFWEWYHNQDKYQTKEDRKANQELYKATISMPEMARLLSVRRSTVYTLLKSAKYGSCFDTILVAGSRVRIKRKEFETWLEKRKGRGEKDGFDHSKES